MSTAGRPLPGSQARALSSGGHAHCSSTEFTTGLGFALGSKVDKAVTRTGEKQNEIRKQRGESDKTSRPGVDTNCVLCQGGTDSLDID